MPMSSYFPFISYSISSFIPISLGLLPIKHGAPCGKGQAEPDPLHVFQECTVQRDEASVCTGSKHSLFEKCCDQNMDRASKQTERVPV